MGKLPELQSLAVGVCNIWYLVGLHPRREKEAIRTLEHTGCETYSPRLDGEPLFPGYLFSRLNDLEVIRRSPFMWLPEFHKVRDELVEGFKATDWIRSEDCTPGSKVRIEKGAFAHHEAIVKAKKADRIVLLLKILGSEQELEFSVRDVEPV
jgi:transcription antitermination factor NusG